MIRATILRFIFLFFTTIVVIYIVPGIVIRGPLMGMGLAFIFALLNSTLKIFLTRFSIGCNILALGPLLLILNTMLLWFLGFLLPVINIIGFWPAFWGGMLISLVSFLLNVWLRDGL